MKTCIFCLLSFFFSVSFANPPAPNADQANDVSKNATPMHFDSEEGIQGGTIFPRKNL